jgi:hypothetical protein
MMGERKPSFWQVCTSSNARQIKYCARARLISNTASFFDISPACTPLRNVEYCLCKNKTPQTRFESWGAR